MNLIIPNHLKTTLLSVFPYRAIFLPKQELDIVNINNKDTFNRMVVIYNIFLTTFQSIKHI